MKKPLYVKTLHSLKKGLLVAYYNGPAVCTRTIETLFRPIRRIVLGIHTCGKIRVAWCTHNAASSLCKITLVAQFILFSAKILIEVNVHFGNKERKNEEIRSLKFCYWILDSYQETRFVSVWDESRLFCNHMKSEAKLSLLIPN